MSSTGGAGEAVSLGDAAGAAAADGTVEAESVGAGDSSSAAGAAIGANPPINVTSTALRNAFLTVCPSRYTHASL